MRKIILLVMAAIMMVGCSTSNVKTSWSVSADPLENEEYELHAELEKTTSTSFASLPFVRFKIEKIDAPALVLKPGVPAEDRIVETDNSRTLQSKAVLNPSNKTVTFELVVEEDGALYSTNGVLAIE